MNILHISTPMTWRGGEQQIAYLIEELKKKGISQYLMCPKGSMMENHALKQDIRHYTFVKKGGVDFAAASLVKKLCKQERIDIVHLHDAHAHTYGVLAATLWRNKTKLILSRRVDFPIKQNWFSKFKYNHSSIQKILCVSDAILKILEPDIRDTSKLQTVHSGIDTTKFSFSNQNILRKSYQISSDKLLIGNVAAIAPHKDYFTFVGTAEKLIQQGIKAHFFIIGGDGGAQDIIKDYIQTKQLNSHITLTGFRDDVPQILPELDVFLFTSKTEGLGTSVLDAFASKVPVVATDAGGVGEMVKHQKTGMLAPVTDSNSLAKYVLQLVDNQVFKADLIANASIKLQAFTKEVAAQKTYTIYQQVSKNLL